MIAPTMRAMTTTNSQHNQQQGGAGSCCADAHDEVALAAFSIYQKHGSLDGHDVRNWLDAEAHVHAKHADSKRGHKPGDKPVGQSAR
jgi:hypothetical protein